MKFHTTKDARVIISQSALAAIFDQCDHFDQDETGGRVIGTFELNSGNLTLHINGVIESGPQAQRTPVSFFQDGEYQERIFRQIERSHPEIEHLGNWHTHHVNGYSTLSSGDIATYQRTVNHPNHNVPFFYALLVTARRRAKTPHLRYEVKHYILRRNDEQVYEIPSRQVEIVDTPLVWPLDPAHNANPSGQPTLHKFGVRPERVYDQDILSEFYQGVRPFASKKLGLYWRGPIELVDGSKVQVVLVEDSSSQVPNYSIVLRDLPDSLTAIAEHLGKQEFPSVRVALITTERTCNHILYEQHCRS